MVRSWWSTWPQANLAVATGRTSGIVVVDLDLPAATASLALVSARLPVTLTALSGGGGIHLFYGCDRPLGNSAARLPGIPEGLPGVDLRAEGGYVVAPPSLHACGLHYSWLHPGRDPAPLPEWIHEPHSRGSRAAALPARCRGDGTPYGLRALTRELERLRSARVGRRNHELNRAAFAIARLVAGGELPEALARAELREAALGIGLGWREIRATISSAFRAGSARPRIAPRRSRGESGVGGPETSARRPGA